MNNSNSQLVKHLPRTSTFLQPKWLTKDRKWNFVFWLGMSSGFSIGEMFKHSDHFAIVHSVICIITALAITIPMLIFNSTRFVKDKGFLNSEGKQIEGKQIPSITVVGAFIFSILWTLLINMFFSNSFFSNNILVWFPYLSIAFSALCIYFISINCPISILLQPTFWQTYVKITPYCNSHFRPRHSISAAIHDPKYHNLRCNIYRKKH